MRKITAGLLCLSSLLANAEGGKNLTPTNVGGSGTGSNQYIGYLQNGDGTNSLSFLAPQGESGYNVDHRLKVRMKAGETLYYGLQRQTGEGNTVRIQFRRLDNNTVVHYTNITATGTSLNAGVGVIASYARMVAGPQQIVGAGTGYNAAQYTPAAGVIPSGGYIDFAIEILDDGAITNTTTGAGLSTSINKDQYHLWDFSVYAGTVEKPGRLHSKYWSFTADAANNRLSENFKMYTATPNQSGNEYYIKSINLSGMQPWGFFFTTNATGTNVGADYKAQRKSRTGGATAGYAQYENFVNNPDPEFWPSSLIVNPIITPASKCHPSRANGGIMELSVTVTAPGVAIVLLDLNNIDGYQPGTTDVLIEQAVAGAGTTVVTWNGLDGLGNNVPSGTAFKTIFRYGSFPVHYPIYDAENNSDGFAITDERPAAAGTPAIAFWDDSDIVANHMELFGIASGSSVHPWGGTGTGINAANIGDVKLFNTWIYGQLREFRNTYLHVYNCVNQPPVANNFTNQPIAQTSNATLIPALSASDIDGTVASYTITSIPATADGVLTVCSNGTQPCTGTQTPVTAGMVITPAQAASLSFNPGPAFSGVTQFTFTATDNSGNTSNTATYKLPVTANPPVANNIITASLPNSSAATPIPSLSATDVDGTIQSYTINNIPAIAQGVLAYCDNGTTPCTGSLITVTAGTVLSPAQMATLTFDPVAGYVGTVLFNYTALDNSGNVSNEANYSIPVTPAADGKTPPLASNITAQAVNSSSGPTPIPALNASDIDGFIVGYIIDPLPPASEGVLTYCPNAPTACNAGEYIPVVEGATLTPEQAASLLFDPAPDFSGNASFGFTAIDNGGNTGNTATYYIPVINTPPTVVNVATTVPFNSAATAISPISGSDADGTIASFTVSTVAPATEGVLYYCATGTCTEAQLVTVTAGTSLTPAQANALYFKPATGYSGTTMFSYTATDNNGNISQPGNYSIRINNQPPVAQHITATTMPNTNGATAIPNLSAADSDGTIATYTIHTLPLASQGVLRLNGVLVTAGQVLTSAQISQLSFAPTAGFTGLAIFNYSATDNGGSVSNLANYTIPVSGSGNIRPVTNTITAPPMSNNSGATTLPTLTGSDVDGTITTYTIETLPPAFQGQLLFNGTPVLPGQTFTPAQAAQLQFVPNAGFVGNAIFEYAATDNNGAKSDITTYYVPVTNVPPVANPVIAPTMSASAGLTSIPALSATDADGTIANYIISTIPPASQGILRLNGVAVTAGQTLTPVQVNQLSFTPAASYIGQTVFNYYAVDNNGNLSNTTTYTINATGVPPVSQNVTAPIIVSNSGEQALSPLNSGDADGTVVSYTITNLPFVNQGVLLLNGAPVTAGQVLTPTDINNLSFIPATGFSGNALFNYTAIDNSGKQSNIATYNIPVNTQRALPVTMTVFKGALVNNTTNLTWTTTQEVNTQYFEVLRSNDGATYQPIGSLNAVGNSSNENTYRFTDLQPAPGVNYYRLKIVDVDGSYEYSDIVTIRLQTVVKLTAWPNPFSNKLQLSLLQNNSSTLLVKMFSTTGQLMLQKNVAVVSGNNNITIDNVQSFKAGFYIIEVKDVQTGFIEQIKVVKK